MPRSNRTYPKLFTTWKRSSTALEVNAAELPHLEGHRTKFDTTLAEIDDLSVQQSALRASKQDVSKRLQAAVRRAQTLADFLNTGIREHYGHRSEKLIEFGLFPIRRQSRSAKARKGPAPTPETAK